MCSDNKTASERQRDERCRRGRCRWGSEEFTRATDEFQRATECRVCVRARVHFWRQAFKYRFSFGIKLCRNKFIFKLVSSSYLHPGSALMPRTDCIPLSWLLLGLLWLTNLVSLFGFNLSLNSFVPAPVPGIFVPHGKQTSAPRVLFSSSFWSTALWNWQQQFVACLPVSKWHVGLFLVFLCAEQGMNCVFAVLELWLVVVGVSSFHALQQPVCLSCTQSEGRCTAKAQLSSRRHTVWPMAHLKGHLRLFWHTLTCAHLEGAQEDS